MKSGGALRFIALVFAICVLAYIGLFTADQWLRTRRGPWIVTFTRAEDGFPALVINEPRLGIANVRLVLEGESSTHEPVTVRFEGRGQPIPFGSLVFIDTTYLPGTATFHLFGHEVELLPRTLIVNRKEVPWESGRTLRLTKAEKPPALPGPPPKRRR